MAWAEPLGERTWAIESAGGLGYLLAQQLVGAGEQVLDVPATLASRVRVLASGRSNKNDPNDALSVAGSKDPGSGPNGFQINKTAQAVGLDVHLTGPSWRLELLGPRPAAPLALSRKQLMAMPQHTADLPIACVEGWSSGNQTWTGVRLRDLARMAGAPSPQTAHVQSLQKHGAFRSVILRGNQVMDDDSLLALQVNGVDLSLDHGFPARVIIPANPGVHNTKWVSQISFTA